MIYKFLNFSSDVYSIIYSITVFSISVLFNFKFLKLSKAVFIAISSSFSVGNLLVNIILLILFSSFFDLSISELYFSISSFFLRISSCNFNLFFSKFFIRSNNSFNMESCCSSMKLLEIK